MCYNVVMSKRLILFFELVAITVILLMLRFTNPSSAGPVGVLVFFYNDLCGDVRNCTCVCGGVYAFARQENGNEGAGLHGDCSDGTDSFVVAAISWFGKYFDGMCSGCVGWHGMFSGE